MQMGEPPETFNRSDMIGGAEMSWLQTSRWRAGRPV